jgi:putative membrane protein
MKPSTSNNSLFSARRTLLASAMVVLLGAATAVAQSSSSTDTSRRNQPGTTSGSTGSYDTGSTTESSRTDTTTPSTSTRSGTSGTSGTSRETYGTGSTSTTETGTTSRGEKLSWGDRRFVNKAADEGMAELEIAKLAAQRATNPEVKKFAQKFVDDHTKVNTELLSLASQKNVKVDQEDAKDRAYKRLNKASDSEFDQEFVEHMVEQHEKDVKMYDKAASDAKDPAVRSFASKHVSSLRQHLQEAQSLQQSVMPTGRTDDRSGRSTTPGAPETERAESTDTQRGSIRGTSSESPGSTGSPGTRSGGSSTPPR